MSIMQAFDISILRFIQSNMHCYILDKLMIVLTFIGEGGRLWIVIGCILLLKKEYRRTGLMVLASLLFTYIFGELIIKHIVCRIRPCYAYSIGKLLIAKPNSYSFPSGHTASSFAAAAILSKNAKKYAPLFYSLAGAIAFSRMYLYVHYPTDVIAGIILGLLCAKLSIIIWDKINVNKTNTISS